TFALVAAALVQAFRFEIVIAREQSSAQSTDRSFAVLEAAIAHLRAAQAGYVAAGQDPDVWMKRATGLITDINERLATLQTATRSDEARARHDAAGDATGRREGPR